MAAIEPHQLPEGTIIGRRYEILEVLGQGGFGITYRGYDKTLDVPVAVKEYYPSGIASRYATQSLDVQTGGALNRKKFEEGKVKFLEEARILARYQDDQNVVTVRDFFEENRTAYIIMQYLQGESLKEYVKKNGTLSFDEAYEMLRPVMQSLERMHQEGLIHRDISPSNLIRIKSGLVKLIDFGTAREISSEGEKSLSVMIKPGFAPPEQYHSRAPQGPWTDVYAMCASIYKLITGRTPENSLDRLMGDRLLPPSACGAQITGAQEEVLRQGMALWETDRIRSMHELTDRFDRACRYTEGEAPVQPGRPEYDDERTVLGPVEPAAAQTPEDTTQEVTPGITPDEAVVTAPEEVPVPAAEEAHYIPSEEVTVYQEPPKQDSKPGTAGRETTLRVPRQEKRKKKWLPLAVAAAAVVAAAVFFLFFSGGTTGNKFAGGSVYEHSDGHLTVRYSGSTSDPTPITVDTLDKLDRNKHVTELSFYGCILNDDVIARLASMKRIEELEIDRCSGFSTLASLSGPAALKTLEVQFDESVSFDGGDMFAADLPGLTRFDLRGGQLTGDFSFLEHYPALESLLCHDVKTGGASNAFPALSNLTHVDIQRTGLAGTDLSALGKAGMLSVLYLGETGIESLGFLADSSELSELYAENNNLASTDGLQNKHKLRYLSLNGNRITDIGALSSCPELRYVYLSRNQLEDISVLAERTELYELSLSGNQITDISPLKNCPELSQLDISGNRITDLSSLGGCQKMRSLNISRNTVSSLDFTEHMLELKNLWASENQISDLSGLNNVTQLETVYLDHNRIGDISVLAKNGENLKIAVLDNNRISSLSPLGNCVKLYGLSVNENLLTNVNGLETCQELYYLSAYKNSITDISALSSCPALYAVDLGENDISDISAIGASKASKMALLLQNNTISDISPIFGMRDYPYLSLYNNEITNIKEMAAMTGIGSSSRLYLTWKEEITPEDLGEQTFRHLMLVDTPDDRKVNLEKKAGDVRRENGGSYMQIEFLTAEEADGQIEELRAEIRSAARIGDPEEEE